MNTEQGSPEEARWAHRFLIALVAFGCRFPRLVLTAALGLSSISTYYFYTKLEYRTQRSDLISSRKGSQQRWHRYLEEFGDDDDMVVVVQGGDVPRMKAAIDAIAAAIGKQPGNFDRLFYKVDLRHLQDRALLFLPAPQIQAIVENLRRMGQLLEMGPTGFQFFTLSNVMDQGQIVAASLQPGQPLEAKEEQFLRQLAAISESATATLKDPAVHTNPFSRLAPDAPGQQENLLAQPQYFLSGDGQLAFLLVRPVKEAGSFTAAQRSVAALRQIVDTLRPDYADLQIGLTGLPVLETDEMVAAQRDTNLASWLALGGVSLLFLIVYRGIYYPLLTVATLLLGTSWAMGWLTLTVGHLNILSATFAVMLIGMGDYGVLWVMRYEHERRHGADVNASLRRTAVCVGTGTLTAALTTALAFYAAMLADFQAVAELGWIAGSGVLLCALACFTVLPALLKTFDRRGACLLPPAGAVLPLSAAVAEDDPSGRTWLPALGRWPKTVIAAGLALTLVLGVCACRVRYDHNLLHLQARGLESVKWELTLVEHTAGASWHALSIAATPEEARARKAQFERLPGVSHVVEVASLVPADQARGLEQLRGIQERLRALPPANQIPAPLIATAPSNLKVHLGPLLARLQVLRRGPGAPLLLKELESKLTGLDEQIDYLSDKEARRRLAQYDSYLAADLTADLHQLREVSTPAGITLADLPAPLRERYVGKSGKWLLQVFGKDCLWEFEPLQQFVEEIRTVDPEATGKPFGTVEGLSAMKNGFQWAGLYALLVIVVLLLADFRSIGRALLGLAPLVMGSLMTLGILTVLGMPLNPANMIALPLILGVGVDNGVHILHDYLAQKREGHGNVSHAIGRGVLVKAMTTMIGFGSLMVSSQRGLAGLGFILALGVACCMVMSLVFLPAVLRLWTGRTEAQAEAETRHAAALRQRAAA